jgi:mRNA interferase RelE/StbE
VASYELRIKPSAINELENSPLKDGRRIVARIRALSPRPPSVEILAGADVFRVRQGDYRILYEIDDARHVVTVFRIGHRREVYR